MAVTGPRCCGWHISVSSKGEDICASEFPNPNKNQPPIYTVCILKRLLSASSTMATAEQGGPRSMQRRSPSQTRAEDDGSLTPVTVTKGTQATAQDHKAAPDHDSQAPPVVVGDVGGDEERHDGADVEHVDEDAEATISTTA